MKKFKPLTNKIYVVCDYCRVATDDVSLYTEVSKDEHLCQYCSNEGKSFYKKSKKSTDMFLRRT